MIQHRIERKKDTLRVVVEVPIGEVFAHLGSDLLPRLTGRLTSYWSEVVRDIIEVGEILQNEPETGHVKWFDEAKGWGFITGHDRQDVFVHHRGIAGDGFKTLKKGQQVQFKRRMGRETFEAIDVTPVTDPEIAKP